MEKQPFGRSLLEAFAKVPDSRRGHKGFRHPLAAMLALATAAMLCGARSLNGIAQWGRLQEAEVVRALGFTRDKTPAVSTLHLVFSELDVEAFEGALKDWAHEHLGDRGEAVAIDGKGLRGIHREGLPGVRLVAAYAGEAGLVLAQKGGKHRSARG